MSSQPSTVEVDGYSITSHEDADAMLENLKPEKADSGEARITVREGQAVPIPEPKDKISEAASELGKKGGKAAAEKRAEEAKKAKPAEDEPEQKAKAEPAEVEEEETDEAADIRKPSVKKRIETLAREKREAEERATTERRERERLANEVERLRMAREAPREQHQERKAPERQAPQDDPEPKLDDFEDYADYVKAAGRHAARQEFREQQQKVARQAHAHAFAQRVQGTLSGYQERIKAARAADPDFSTRISADVKALFPSVDLGPGEPLRAGNVIADYIVHSEQAPALLLHLSENPQDFQRIASLGGPRDVERAMARLEGRLDAATAGARVEAEEVSQAKPPLRPVGGSPHTAADIEPSDDDDFDSWSRKMDAKEKRTKR